MSASPETARRNGRLGGRPRGSASKSTQSALVFKEELIKAMERECKPIIDALINKAKEGDVGAAKVLFDRLWGRPQASVDVTSNGEELSAPALINYRPLADLDTATLLRMVGDEPLRKLREKSVGAKD